MSEPNSNLETLPLHCVNTSNFASILQQLEVSLVVTTYQAGKVILVRADGNSINAHFRQFPRPMGLDVNRSRMAIGTKNAVVELYNMPAVAQKLNPIGKHDACYIPRNIHFTGDIDVHELAWAGDRLWLVNTAFSCLCTLDSAYSFSPQWRPPFISALSPGDRCHLNGLAIVQDQPRYITALGTQNTPQGWRDTKADGGIIMDIHTNEILAHSLSMPHSPRWHGDRLWFLESGRGSLATLDLHNGQIITVAEFPGFTRGLAFWGEIAFVGLSQVRESRTFGGLPLTERLTERTCGVWLVHWPTGQTIAFLRFESGVEEVFAVGILPHIQFPEILELDAEQVSSSFALSDAALQEVEQ